MPDTTRTNDPNVVVESYAQARVIFRSLITGRRWAEIGECNRCGLCVSPDDPSVEWAQNIKIGEPGACKDRDYATRPLYVTTPEWQPKAEALARELNVTGCSLTFEELKPDGWR